MTKSTVLSLVCVMTLASTAVHAKTNIKKNKELPTECVQAKELSFKTKRAITAPEETQKLWQEFEQGWYKMLPKKAKQIKAECQMMKEMAQQMIDEGH